MLAADFPNDIEAHLEVERRGGKLSIEAERYRAVQSLRFKVEPMRAFIPKSVNEGYNLDDFGLNALTPADPDADPLDPVHALGAAITPDSHGAARFCASITVGVDLSGDKAFMDKATKRIENALCRKPAVRARLETAAAATPANVMAKAPTASRATRAYVPEACWTILRKAGWKIDRL